MIVPLPILKQYLEKSARQKADQGYDTAEIQRRLSLPCDSYDTLLTLAKEIADAPMQENWPFVEPDDLESIWEECRLQPFERSNPEVATNKSYTNRIETAFLASACGCIIGKPVEINPTLAELKHALVKTGDWPLRDYIAAEIAHFLPRPLHESWHETVRGRIRYVAADDDINYTILGMLVLEECGLNFTHQDLAKVWFDNLPLGITFGPERNILLKIGLNSLDRLLPCDPSQYAAFLNPGDEYCGALIRADAYGYACPGNPSMAATLAWRDASFTHRKTGVYGTMFAAAAIAHAFVAKDPMEIFDTAMHFVPQRSRLYRILADSLHEISLATDWIDGYNRIHGKYSQYTHCLIFQELGTVMNTLRFAESIGDGLCKQVSQGNDTDSFGATAGSILGAYFGPEHLEERWLAPFQDDLRTGLARYYERSLTKTASRMGQLPNLIHQPVQKEEAGPSLSAELGI